VVKISATLAGRLELVGIELFGRVGWRYRLAAGLGIAKSTLYPYLDGKKGRDLDADMIERERTATVTRRLALSQLRDKIAEAAGKEINSDAT
jgi:predicted transcriptional regulator